jgi:hypothetical protein
MLLPNPSLPVGWLYFEYRDESGVVVVRASPEPAVEVVKGEDVKEEKSGGGGARTE